MISFTLDTCSHLYRNCQLLYQCDSLFSMQTHRRMGGSRQKIRRQSVPCSVTNHRTDMTEPTARLVGLLACRTTIHVTLRSPAKQWKLGISFIRIFHFHLTTGTRLDDGVAQLMQYIYSPRPMRVSGTVCDSLLKSIRTTVRLLVAPITA